jgi:Glycogen synthase
MYSLLYGTVPIVRKTGGLKDTVIGIDKSNPNPTGLVFEEYTPAALVGQVKIAIEIFNRKDAMTALIKNGMRSDFSWQLSAKKYADLYRRVSAG